MVSVISLFYSKTHPCLLVILLRCSFVYTIDFVNYLKDYTGVDMYDKFMNWLYYEENQDYNADSTSHDWMNIVDLTPPENIRQKYGYNR